MCRVGRVTRLPKEANRADSSRPPTTESLLQRPLGTAHCVLPIKLSSQLLHYADNVDHLVCGENHYRVGLLA